MLGVGEEVAADNGGKRESRDHHEAATELVRQRTEYELRRYGDLFVVGQARLGLDTQLGLAPVFTSAIEGRSYVGRSYLGFPYPLDVIDRVVPDRDRLGGLPPL